MSAEPSKLRSRIPGTTTAGEVTRFSAYVLRDTWTLKVFHYIGEAIRQAGILITGSMFVVVVLMFTTGTTCGIESAFFNRATGSPSYAGIFAALCDLRELGPYAFGYMFAAKVGTGLVAEIGAMRVGDEVDALEVMGIDSLVYLCATRLLACWMVIPFIYMIGLAASYLASYIGVIFIVGDTAPGGYNLIFWFFQSPADLLFSLIKAMAMATMIVLVGAYYGFTASGGPVGVGNAAAKSMVFNVVGVHVIGMLGTLVFWGTDPRAPIGGVSGPMDVKRGLALAALGVVVLAVVVLLMGLGGGSGYTVTAEFDDAGQMIKGNDVRIGASKVGAVSDIELSDDGTAEITMEIDDDTAPIPEGTTAAVRQTSLFGIANRFIVLQPPPGESEPLPDGGRIGLTGTTSPVEFDALLNTLNGSTRLGLQQLIQGGAALYSGQAENANETIHWIGPTFAGSSKVLGELAKDQDAFASLLNQASATARAVTSRRNDLVDLISNTNATTKAFGDQAIHLERAVGQLPATLRRSNTTFVALREAMDDLDPFVATAKEDTQTLPAFLAQVRPLLKRAKATVPKAAAIVNTKGKANDLRNLLGRSQPLDATASYAIPDTIAFMNSSQETIDLFRAYTPDIFGAVANVNDLAGHYDANGHYLRSLPVLGAVHYNLGLNQIEPQPIADRLNDFELGTSARCPGGALPPAPDLSLPVTVPGCNPALTPPGP